MTFTIQKYRDTRVPPVMSVHGSVRVVDRTALTESELLEAIRIQHCPRIDCNKRRSHLNFLLLWDFRAKNYLVIVQDILDGTIVTILTLQMYLDQKYGPSIDQNLIRHFEIRLEREYPGDFRSVSAKASRTITVTVKTRHGEGAIKLGTWHSTKKISSAADAGSDKCFWKWAITRAKDLGLSMLSLDSVYGRVADKQPQVIPFSTPKPQYSQKGAPIK